MDETYIKINKRWVYLYRALDKHGNTIDFQISRKRNIYAAKRFLKKALKSFKPENRLSVINTNKNPTYIRAIKQLKREGICSSSLEHRSNKYLNNGIEGDHSLFKRILRTARGLKSIPTAMNTIRGIELMRMFRKGQFDIWLHGSGIIGEVRLMNRVFSIYSMNLGKM